MKIIHHRLCHDDGTPVPFVETANMEGALTPEFAVMHYTAGPSMASAIGALTRRRPWANVSAHLIIGRGGEVVQLAPMDRVTWHAGGSRWAHKERDFIGLNHHAIGIELVNAGPLDSVGNGTWRAWWGRHYPAEEVIEARHKHGGRWLGWMRFPEAQMAAAYQVARALVCHYRLLDVIGHDDIAPGRKRDPGPAFALGDFRQRLYHPAASSAANDLAGG